jgi:hypothetical protein
MKKTENKKKPADVDKLSLREISAECFDQRPEPRLHVIGLVSAMPCFSSCPRVLNRVTKKEKKNREKLRLSRVETRALYIEPLQVRLPRVWTSL